MRILWKNKDINLNPSWAKGIFYSKKKSGLKSTNVQDAIDELIDNDDAIKARINSIVTSLLNDYYAYGETSFTVSVGATTAVNFGIKTMEKAGYTPIFAVLTASSYGDYSTINQTWSFSNGSAAVSGWVGNWKSGSITTTCVMRVLWKKNTL